MPYLLSCHSLAKAKEGSFVRRDYDGLFSSAEQVIREAPSPTQLKQKNFGTLCGSSVCFKFRNTHKT